LPAGKGVERELFPGADWVKGIPVADTDVSPEAVVLGRLDVTLRVTVKVMVLIVLLPLTTKLVLVLVLSDPVMASTLDVARNGVVDSEVGEAEKLELVASVAGVLPETEEDNSGVAAEDVPVLTDV
jgi:hypothetical protein